jgi:hypothetical protein
LGRVAHHKGDYHDAIHAKRNTVDLCIHNTLGGFNRSAARALHALSKRATDRTEYENWVASKFKPYWGQRISAAIVMADAKRCRHALSSLRGKARGALPRTLCHAPPPPSCDRH